MFNVNVEKTYENFQCEYLCVTSLLWDLDTFCVSNHLFIFFFFHPNISQFRTNANSIVSKNQTIKKKRNRWMANTLCFLCTTTPTYEQKKNLLSISKAIVACPFFSENFSKAQLFIWIWPISRNYKFFISHKRISPSNWQ